MNIPAIETSVLPPLDSYLDRDNNIPPEDGDQPPPPPPAEIDPIWHDHGAFWPYVPNASEGSGWSDFQPPSQPPSPGLSYRTPRTPSLRHRSVTPSHHSSGNSRPRSTHSNPSTGNTGSRSQTLTEEGNPLTGQPVTPNTYDFDAIRRIAEESTKAYYKARVQELLICRGLIPPAQQSSADPDTEAESSRVAACREALESPLAPRSLAISESEIASYPREWRDGARSGKYSYIPSYQGWRRGEQLELAQSG